MRAMGYLFSALWIGFLYDKFRGHPMMGLALLSLCILNAFIPTSSSLLALGSLFLLSGIGAAFADIGGNTLIMRMYGSKGGPYLNALHFSFGLGAVMAPLVVAYFLKQTGAIEWSYWSLSLYILPLAVWILLSKSPERKQKEAADPRPDTLSKKSLALIVGFFFFYACCELSFSGWIYTYAITIGLADKITAAYLTSVFWGAITLGRLAVIPLSRRFLPNKLLLAHLIGAVVSISYIYLKASDPYALWAGTFCFGLSLSSIFPTMLAFVERRVPVSGKYNGWFFTGASSGAMVAPWLVGQGFEPIGPSILPLTILICALLALCILVLLHTSLPAQQARNESSLTQ